MYQLLILPSAAKYLKKIKDVKLKSLFKETVDKIILNPYQGERKTGNLSDLYGVDFHYNKTNYEVAYKIIKNEDRQIIVILAGTRENFYEELKRLI
jgi:mRNA interferase RelE/StbE